MDELEISGKRYISTRRAAREHGYHSDYMGQLIRGKKVAGQKVGRAWYIEEESLSVYLGKTPPPAPAPTTAPATEAPAPVPQERLVVEEPAPAAPIIEEAPAVAAPQPVQHTAAQIRQEEHTIAVRTARVSAEPVAYAEPAVVAAPVQEIHHAPIYREQEIREETRIPIHTPAPAPAVQHGGLRYAEDTTASIPVIARMPQAHAAAPAAYDYAQQKPVQGTFPFISLSIVGVIAILVTAFASNFVTATVVTKPGQAATVQYAIHW